MIAVTTPQLVSMIESTQSNKGATLEARNRWLLQTLPLLSELLHGALPLRDAEQEEQETTVVSLDLGKVVTHHGDAKLNKLVARAMYSMSEHKVLRDEILAVGFPRERRRKNERSHDRSHERTRAAS